MAAGTHMAFLVTRECALKQIGSSNSLTASLSTMHGL